MDTLIIKAKNWIAALLILLFWEIFIKLLSAKALLIHLTLIATIIETTMIAPPFLLLPLSILNFGFKPVLVIFYQFVE
jgi:hypothetical protein